MPNLRSVSSAWDDPKFEKPGRRVNDDGSPWDYPDMARESGIKKALADAGIDYREVRRPTSATSTASRHRASGLVYGELGMTGIGGQCQQQLLDRIDGAVPRGAGPSALELADCALALGFEDATGFTRVKRMATASSRWPGASWRWPRSPKCCSAGALDVRRGRSRAHGSEGSIQSISRRSAARTTSIR